MERNSFREARSFLALLLIGGPALYSVEAYFTAFNTALQTKEVDWTASAYFSLIYLTFNIRFINGNYDHVKSDGWVDKRGLSYVIDVAAILLMHAILVVMAGRCFITEGGIPVLDATANRVIPALPGVTVVVPGAEEAWVPFKCPGFFACLLGLMVVDCVWLLFKGGIELFIGRWISRLEAKVGSQAKRRRLLDALKQLRGDYSKMLTKWLAINSISIVALIVLAFIARATTPDHYPDALQFWQIPIADRIYSNTPGEWLLIVLVVASLVATVIDLGATKVGQKAISEQEQFLELSAFVEVAAKEAEQTVERYKTKPGNYTGQIPIGITINLAGQSHTFFYDAVNGVVDEQSLQNKLKNYLISNVKGPIQGASIEMYALLCPDEATLTEIEAVLLRHRNQTNPKMPFDARLSYCRNFNDLRGHSHQYAGKIRLEAVDYRKSAPDETARNDYEMLLSRIDAVFDRINVYP